MHLQELVKKVTGTEPRSISARNSPVRPPGVPFAFQDLSNPLLKRLHKKYNLHEVVENGSGHLHKTLLLRNWIHKTIPSGKPAHSILDPFAILDTAAEGGTFYCTHYAFLFVCCALSLGYTARKLGVDRYHEPEQDSWHHGVAEVYLHDLDKWVAMDPMYNIHYELDGLPLNALEIREALLSGSKRRIVRAEGPSRKASQPVRSRRRFDSPQCYFWSLIESGNDYLSIPENQNGRRQYVFRDRHNKSKVWYQGRGTTGESYPHRGYGGAFIDVENADLLYPTVGRTHLQFSSSGGKALVVRACTFMPSFSHFEWFVDGKKRRSREASIQWRLHKGDNRLRARAVNVLDVEGSEASVCVSL